MAALLLALTGCGDRVPESAAAKKIGDIPKQTLDWVREDVGRAARQDIERAREADEKSN